MKCQLRRVRGPLARALVLVSLAMLAACQGSKAPSPKATEPRITGLFDPSIADLINTYPGMRQAPTPEPKIIPQGDRSTLVYSAKHARPAVLREAVQGLLNPDGTVQDSAALNTLVIQDQTDVVQNILTVLQTLDVPTPQLLVEARIVEVTLTDDLEYEITHTLSIPTSPGALLQNTDVTLSVPGTPTSGQGAMLHIRPWASADIQLDNFVRLLETKGKANILSSPNVIVAPGTESSIITGEEVPIQSTTVVSGSLTTNTVFKHVGIKLRVALQQITADVARMEINPEVSTVTGTEVSQGVSNPIISLRNVTSTVSLKDGEILTIGGLLQNEDQYTTRGIPGLQDIPKAGVLFQSQRDTRDKTQLIFFLRVHILPEGVPGGLSIHTPGEGMNQFNPSDLVPATQPAATPATAPATQPGR